jgi:hypothetical protein
MNVVQPINGERSATPIGLRAGQKHPYRQLAGSYGAAREAT